MAKTFTPQDAAAVLNLLSKEITGRSANITAINSSNFVSVGETILSAGTENVLNALGIVLGRTFMAVRPYKAKLAILNAIDSGIYTNRIRKISVYSADALESGAFNTNENTNLKDGFDNTSNPNADGVAQATPSMWVQHTPEVLEVNFHGRNTWQECLTIYKVQLQTAFRSLEEFTRFLNGIMVEKANDIETRKESYNRMTLLNFMAGAYDLSAKGNGNVVDLTAGFNTKFGTKYTRAELLTTHLKDFLGYFVSTFKQYSNLMELRSSKYHWSPTKTDAAGNALTLLRHTSKSRQRALLYSPMFMDAEAMVLPQIFNPSYLDINNFEKVMYWQNLNNPSAINVTPAIPNTTSPGSQTNGAVVSLPYVVGLLYDVDALMVDYQLEDSESTPMEARKKYRNLWWTFAINSINDFTENHVLFIMGNGGEAK